MKVIEVELTPLIPRKAYQLDEDEQQYLDFKPEIEVLPASHYDSEHNEQFFYITKHEPGTKGWKNGGYECYDNYNIRRAFHLDALIIHPKVFQGKGKSVAAKQIVPDKPKGKRGRPKMDPSLRKVKTEYISTGRGKGRPRKNPDGVKVKQYIPTGKPRGRKPLSEEEKLRREQEKQLTSQRSQGRRGRPRHVRP